MYKKCNTEESAHRQQQLEECLLENMLVRPYCEISVSDLCQQAGISRKSFYRYFGNKDGCLNALLDRVLIEMSKPPTSDMPSSSEYPLDLFHALSYWKQHKTLLDTLAENNLTDKLLERVMLHTVKEEKNLLHCMGIDDNLQDCDALLFSVSGYVSLIMHWNATGFQKSPQELVATLIRLTTKPLLCLPGHEENTHVSISERTL